MVPTNRFQSVQRSRGKRHSTLRMFNVHLRLTQASEQHEDSSDPQKWVMLLLSLNLRELAGIGPNVSHAPFCLQPLIFKEWQP